MLQDATGDQAPTWRDFIPTFRYAQAYGGIVRGEQGPRPWNLCQEVQQFAKPGATLLDVGCGTAQKLLDIAPAYGRVVGVEPNPALRQTAQQAASARGLHHVTIMDGHWQALPIATQSVDVITSMLAGFFVEEIVRVLKPRGAFVLESIGPRDQVSIKAPFGRDARGPRGQYLHFSETKFRDFVGDALKPKFSSVDITNGFWSTTYKPEELPRLLTSTPLVRDFDIDKDATALASLVHKQNAHTGITTTQNRMLVVCRDKASA